MRTPTIWISCERTRRSSSLAGRLPERRDLRLCSQPTLSRLEMRGLKDVFRLTYALVDAWLNSYEREPASVTLDIDDTCDVAHRQQQLSLFNGHYGSAAFCQSMSTTPTGCRLSPSCCVRARRPAASRFAPICAVSCATFASAGPRPASCSGATAITLGPKAMAWCEDNGVDYVFGLPGTKQLSRKVEETADAVRTEPRSTTEASCAITPRRGTRRSHGTASAALSPHRGDQAWPRHPLRGPPQSTAARRNGSMTACIARAAKPKTSSTFTRPSLRPIARPVIRRCRRVQLLVCAPQLLGSCSPSATPFPRRATWRKRSLRRCA